MVFAMVPAGVGASAAMESGLAAEMGAGAAGVAPPLLGAVPMGADADSVWFAEVCRAVAAEHLAVAGEHAVARGLFSGAQSLAVATTVATEVMRAAAATI
ncbi:MAG TPA: PE family protein [Mycobacterium sp.]|nr:PE family protein [Mycobacterium sp.]